MSTKRPELIEYIVGQPHPFKLPHGTGARSDFLRENVNTLLVLLDDITSFELKILKSGTVEAGLLTANGAILIVWRFSLPGSHALIFDCPFDVRLIPSEELMDISAFETSDNPNTRLLIDIQIVEAKTKIIKGIRGITFSPAFTRRFFAAVKEQFNHQNSGQQQLIEWQAESLGSLVRKADMTQLGLK